MYKPKKIFLRKKIKRDDDGCRLKTNKRNGIKGKKVHKYRENWKTWEECRF